MLHPQLSLPLLSEVCASLLATYQARLEVMYIIWLNKCSKVPFSLSNGSSLVSESAMIHTLLHACQMTAIGGRKI